MEMMGEKKEFKAPDDLIQFIVDTRDGKFNCSTVTLTKNVSRLPNYQQIAEPVYLHGIR
jgi:hypothetical protein